MKKNILIFIFIAFCASMISCKKETAPELEYLKIPDEVWSYVYLTPGSWYIYKDSATGLTDSVVVTKSVINYKAPVNFITSSTLFYTDDYILILDKVDLAGNKTLWLDAISNGVILFGAKAWFFPGLLQYPYTTIPGLFTVYKIPTATIEGNNYSDILITEGGAWWVKGVGLIKLFYRGNTFTLLRKK